MHLIGVLLEWMGAGLCVLQIIPQRPVQNQVDGEHRCRMSAYHSLTAPAQVTVVWYVYMTCTCSIAPASSRRRQVLGSPTHRHDLHRKLAVPDRSLRQRVRCQADPLVRRTALRSRIPELTPCPQANFGTCTNIMDCYHGI